MKYKYKNKFKYKYWQIQKAISSSLSGSQQIHYWQCSPARPPDHQTHIKQVTDKSWQMQIKIGQMQIQKDKYKYNQTHIKHVTNKIWQTQIRIQKYKYTDNQLDIRQVTDKI